MVWGWQQNQYFKKQRFGIFIVIRIYIFNFCKTVIIRTYSEDIVTKEIFYSARFLSTADSLCDRRKFLFLSFSSAVRRAANEKLKKRGICADHTAENLKNLGGNP